MVKTNQTPSGDFANPAIMAIQQEPNPLQNQPQPPPQNPDQPSSENPSSVQQDEGSSSKSPENPQTPKEKPSNSSPPRESSSQAAEIETQVQEERQVPEILEEQDFDIQDSLVNDDPTRESIPEDFSIHDMTVEDGTEQNPPLQPEEQPEEQAASPSDSDTTPLRVMRKKSIARKKKGPSVPPLTPTPTPTPTSFPTPVRLTRSAIARAQAESSKKKKQLYKGKEKVVVELESPEEETSEEAVPTEGTSTRSKEKKKKRSTPLKRKSSSQGTSSKKTVTPKSKKRKVIRGESSESERDDSDNKKPKVLVSRTYHIQWLIDNHCQNLLRVIEKQHWEHLFEKELLMYSEAVEEFYANLEIDRGLCLSSVQGIEIRFTSVQLGSILGISAAGFAIYTRGTWPKIDRFTAAECCQILAKDTSITIARNLWIGNLTAFNRVLHNLVFKTILPRNQHRNEVNPMDQTIMRLLDLAEPINLPSLMISHMERVLQDRGVTRKKSPHSLPYGMWLTIVFIHFRVPLEGLKRAKTASQPFDANVLKSMGIMVDEVTGEFEWKVAPAPPPAGSSRRAALVVPTEEDPDETPPLQGIDRLIELQEELRDILAATHNVQERSLSIQQRQALAMEQLSYAVVKHLTNQG